MTGSLGYRKICARWVPRLLTGDRKVQGKAITSEMLRRYWDEGDDLLLSIVAGDESWFHHFNEAVEYGMASFAFTNKKETKDYAIS